MRSWRVAVLAGLAAGALASPGPALAAPGDLDQSFDGDGRLLTAFPPASDAFLEDVLVQPDGRTVAAGGSSDDFLFARYNADGSLDSSFDGDGRRALDFDAANSFESANGIAPYGDGRLVAAGNVRVPPDPFPNRFGIARLNQDGTPDGSFGGGGTVTIDLPVTEEEAAADVAVQPDGKVVAAGFGRITDVERFVVARYTTGGALDGDFSGDGAQQTVMPGSSESSPDALLVQPDGKIVAAGEATVGGAQQFALARYDPSGALDSSFAGGTVVTDIPGVGDEGIFDMLLQPDGRLVVVGYANEPDGFTLARYNPDGQLDQSFDGDGIVVATFGGGLDFGSGEGVALQQNGRIVVGGNVETGGNRTLLLARYLPDGALDPTFSGDGFLLQDFPEGGEEFTGVTAVGPDGRIVLAGDSDVGGFRQWVLARFEGDPLPLPVPPTQQQDTRDLDDPLISMVIGRTTIRRLIRTRRLRLVAGLDEAGRLVLRVSVPAKRRRARGGQRRRRARSVTIAKSTVRFTTASRRRVRLRLSRRAVRQLRGRRRVRLTLNATGRDVAGNSVTRKRSRTIRR